MANGSHWQMDEPMSSLSFAHQMSQPPSQKGGMPGTPAGQLPSSAGGAGQEDLQFRTFEPRSREQRRADLDKTSREKARIAQRYPNAEPPPCDVIAPIPQSAFYMDDYSRYTCKDAAALEHDRKQAELQKKEAVYARKRQENYERETRNWHLNQVACDKGDAVATAKREAEEGGTRRSRGGASYNIISLDYAKTPGGEVLKHQDSITQYKAHLRSNNLYNKGHSSGFNILTGEPAWRPADVAPPTGLNAAANGDEEQKH